MQAFRKVLMVRINLKHFIGITETNETGATTDLCESATKKLAADSVTEESSSTEKLNKLKNVSSTLSKQQTEVEEERTASSPPI